MLTFSFIQNLLPFAINVNATCPMQLLRFKLQMLFTTKNQSHGPVAKWPFSISEIQKPQMKNVKDEDQIKNLAVNIILIFDLQMNNKSMNNNCKNEGFGIQRSEDDMSRILTKLAIIFVQSLGVFAQTSDLLAQSIEKSVQSTYVWSQSTYELTQSVGEQAHLAKGVHGEQGAISIFIKGRLVVWSNWKMKFAAFIHNDDMDCFHMVIQKIDKLILMGHINFEDHVLIKRQ